MLEKQIWTTLFSPPEAGYKGTTQLLGKQAAGTDTLVSNHTDIQFNSGKGDFIDTLIDNIEESKLRIST